MTKNQSQISEDNKKAAEILTKAKEDVMKILDDENHGHTKIFVEQRINMAINRTRVQAGLPLMIEHVNTGVLTPYKEPGEKTPEEQEELSADELRRKQFLDKVDKLQESLDVLSNEQILESYKTADDQLAIRGLAKRAGLDDYKSGVINEAFLELIREGVKDRADAEAEKAKKDAVIAGAGQDDENEDEDLTK